LLPLPGWKVFEVVVVICWGFGFWVIALKIFKYFFLHFFFGATLLFVFHLKVVFEVGSRCCFYIIFYFVARTSSHRRQKVQRNKKATEIHTHAIQVAVVVDPAMRQQIGVFN